MQNCETKHTPQALVPPTGPANLYLNYLFQKVLQTISRFIWAHKLSRIKQAMLRLPRDSGGMALPDIYLYYVAVHMKQLTDCLRHQDLKQWVAIEQDPTYLPLLNLLGSHRGIPTHLKSYVTINQILRVCSKAIMEVFRLNPCHYIWY